MKIKKYYLQNQKGFSLLELLLVIGVGAMLLLSGIAIYRMVTRDKTVNDITEVVLATKTAIHRLYRTESTYGVGNLLPAMVAAKIFPNNVHVDPAGPTAYHPSGGIIDVNATGGNFSILISGLEPSACIKLGQALNPDTESDMVSLEVDSGAVTVFDLSNPATPAALTGACSAALNDLTFIFI